MTTQYRYIIPGITQIEFNWAIEQLLALRLLESNGEGSIRLTTYGIERTEEFESSIPVSGRILYNLLILERAGI